MDEKQFVSRAGIKLQFAIDQFGLNLKDKTCADFGCSTGGFTDCMLKSGAEKVYSVDTAYGELDYGLRKNPQVIVLERNNAMHVQLPEKVDFLSIDVAWTKQDKVIPNAISNIKPDGKILSLVKPHYEASREELDHGVARLEAIPNILKRTEDFFERQGLKILNKIKSPITGKRAGNEEWVYELSKK